MQKTEKIKSCNMAEVKIVSSGSPIHREANQRIYGRNDNKKLIIIIHLSLTDNIELRFFFKDHSLFYLKEHS